MSKATYLLYLGFLWFSNVFYGFFCSQPPHFFVHLHLVFCLTSSKALRHSPQRGEPKLHGFFVLGVMVPESNFRACWGSKSRYLPSKQPLIIPPPKKGHLLKVGNMKQKQFSKCYKQYKRHVFETLRHLC